MQVEQLEILDFLKAHIPFSLLSEEALKKTAQSIDVSYYQSGEKIVAFGEKSDYWYIVRSGAVEIFRRDGTLYNRLTEGGYFGEFGLLRSGVVRFPSTALEDSLLYLIPADVFVDIFESNEEFADRVEIEDRTRLRHVVSQNEDTNQLLTADSASLIHRTPVTISKNASATEAAKKMALEDISSLLITEKIVSETLVPENTIIGILTDRDLCTRLLAKNLDASTPVSELMSLEPISIQHNQLVFEAMLKMMRHNVHHLFVLKDESAIGVISLTDVMHYESKNSVFIVSSIFKQNSIEELAALRPHVISCFTNMVAEDANSRMIGHAMATIGRSFKQRLLELAEQTLGPPPVPYCFLALGSMARQEQLIVTDQDNAMILDDRFQPEFHDNYFSKLAQFVCDGLAQCGYSYCSGNIMATNPKWRQPLQTWKNYFTTWIQSPTPQSLLDSGIFFEMEGVWGKTAWAKELFSIIIDQSRRSPRFLACMARNALLRTPPLGFFKDFVMESDGKHSHSINMKRRGTAPLSDLVRVHSLAIGSKSKNSFDRLKDIIRADILPRGRGQDLLDALEFISMVRIRHQADDLTNEQTPDNSIQPESLSDFERKNLRDAFLIVSNAQKFLRYRYQPGRSNST